MKKIKSDFSLGKPAVFRVLTNPPRDLDLILRFFFCESAPAIELQARAWQTGHPTNYWPRPKLLNSKDRRVCFLKIFFRKFSPLSYFYTIFHGNYYFFSATNDDKLKFLGFTIFSIFLTAWRTYPGLRHWILRTQCPYTLYFRRNVTFYSRRSLKLCVRKRKEENSFPLSTFAVCPSSRGTRNDSRELISYEKARSVFYICTFKLGYKSTHRSFRLREHRSLPPLPRTTNSSSFVYPWSHSTSCSGHLELPINKIPVRIIFPSWAKGFFTKTTNQIYTLINENFVQNEKKKSDNEIFLN